MSHVTWAVKNFWSVCMVRSRARSELMLTIFALRLLLFRFPSYFYHSIYILIATLTTDSLASFRKFSAIPSATRTRSLTGTPIILTRNIVVYVMWCWWLGFADLPFRHGPPGLSVKSNSNLMLLLFIADIEVDLQEPLYFSLYPTERLKSYHLDKRLVPPPLKRLRKFGTSVTVPIHFQV